MFRRALTTQIAAASDRGATMASAYVTWWGAVQLLAAGTAVNQYITANQIDVLRIEVRKDVELLRTEVRADVDCVKKDVECVKKDVQRLQRSVDRVGDDVAEILRNQRRRWF